MNTKKIIEDTKESRRKKALDLINAHYDGKEIIMKDPEHGVHHWTNAFYSHEYWSYIQGFLDNLDKYQIVEDEAKEPEETKESI